MPNRISAAADEAFAEACRSARWTELPTLARNLPPGRRFPAHAPWNRPLLSPPDPALLERVGAGALAFWEIWSAAIRADAGLPGPAAERLAALDPDDPKQIGSVCSILRSNEQAGHRFHAPPPPGTLDPAVGWLGSSCAHRGSAFSLAREAFLAGHPIDWSAPLRAWEESHPALLRLAEAAGSRAPAALAELAAALPVLADRRSPPRDPPALLEALRELGCDLACARIRCLAASGGSLGEAGSDLAERMART